MQKESRDLSPFQERVNVDLFFSGARRRKLLEEIKKAVFDGVPVITITGDEGTGKTMICRMVEKELPAEYSCVYLPNTLESFDDVVRILALGLGTENSENPGSSKDLVEEIIRHLEDSDRQLVAIFDQSERMYLATLERIRKMLDQINDNKVLFQIILAGRKILLENLKQLAICDFKNVEERPFSFEYLGLSETYAYLNHSVQSRSPGRGKNVFSPEAAKKIYSMAQGNFRMTNMLAEKSLESFDSETSFMVLLENVHDEGSTVAKNGNVTHSFYSSKKWLASAVGLLFVVAAGLYYVVGDENPFASDKKNRAEIPAVSMEKETGGDVPPEQTSSVLDTRSKKKGVITDSPKEITQPLISENNHTTKGKKQNTAKVTDKISGAQNKQPPERMDGVEISQQLGYTPPDTARQITKKIAGEDRTGEKKGEIPSETESVQSIEEVSPKDHAVADKKIRETAKNASSTSSVEKHKIATHKVVTSPIRVESKNPESSEKQITVLKDTENYTVVEVKDGSTALPPDVALDLVQNESEDEVVTQTVADEKPITLSDGKKRKPPSQQSEVRAKKLVRIAPITVKNPAAEPVDYSNEQEETMSLDQLYQQRVDAASRWLSGNNNDKKTVQLMMLTSAQAEENLKKRFEQEEYREISDKLYIIRSKYDSSVFVYYGEYPDRDSARKVRNTLPIFLRKHNPYVISVENAVKKATSQ